MRGAQLFEHVHVCAAGIIPACAGSTEVLFLSTVENQGSSPHVRGARCRKRAFGAGRGIIPACAGSTICSTTWFLTMRDHPRMCGEHSLDAMVRVEAEGSSPHVRGALFRRAFREGNSGIIPACAGSTLKYLAFLGYSSAFSFGSQGSKLFTCVVFYPPNFRAL